MPDSIKTNGFSKEKIAKFMRDLDKADDTAAVEHDKISKRHSDALANVREAADVIGIKPRIFGKLMSEHRLRRKADAIRDDFADNVGGDEHGEELIDQLDAVRLAAGLPLFDAAEKETDGKDKKAKKGDKVVPLKPEFKDDSGGGKPH